MATFSQLKDEVLSHQFSTSQYSDYAGARINEGQLYVTAQTDFRELEDSEAYTTVSGTSTLALPSDYQRVYTLTVTNSNNTLTGLEQTSRSDIDTMPTDSTGKPEKYCIDGSNIKLWPTPDAAYTMTLRHYRDPATLTNASDTPEIPGKYHHLLVSYALWKCYERENDYNAAIYHKGRFDEDIMKCRGEVQYDHDDYSQPRQLGENRTDALGPVDYGIWGI